MNILSIKEEDSGRFLQRMTSSQPAMHVGVVNDHHDINPFLHALMRKKLIPLGMEVIHFDSHADLCCPSSRQESPETAWADKHQLYYDVLGDKRTAISEFLIPLMYRGDIGRVVWVRPKWQNMGLRGPGQEIVDYHVGFDRHNQPSVDYCCAYYLEEGSYTPEPLRHSKRCRVRTCHAEDLCNSGDQPLEKNIEAAPWILDVCLDYFSTMNPFLPALERSLRVDLGSDDEVKEALDNIKGMFRDTPFRSKKEGDLRELRVQVLAALKRLLLHQEGEQRFLELSPSPSSKAFVGHTLARLSAATKSLIDEAGMCILLPHHPSSDAEVRELLVAFHGTLHELRRFAPQMMLLSAPACVTIARSVGEGCISMSTCEKDIDERNKGKKRGRDGTTKSEKVVLEDGDDGFTPALQADMIQREVIRIITEVFVDQGRELHVHELYSKGVKEDDDLDCYEKCHSLFLNKRAPKLAVE